MTKASDVMTTNVVSVSPSTPVQEVASLLLARHVSGVPVLDDSGHLVGIVSEGDLMRRVASGAERHRSWWLDLLSGSEESRAEAFIKAHGRRARDVMTRRVHTVTEDTPLAEVAHALESHRIKRVPVVRDRKVVGVVSRADLIRGLAVGSSPETRSDDHAIRAAIDRLIDEEDWMTHGSLNATVKDGVVDVWGWAGSEVERKAIEVALENIEGVRKVEMHVGLIAPYLRGV